MLVVIGPRWVDMRENGVRRLDDPADYVRREVELALEADTLLVPVLVEGASAPEAGKLPPSIRALHRRNSVELTHERWQADTDALVRQLEKRGIRALDSPRQPANATLPAAANPATAGRGMLRPFVQFLPDLLALLRHPRRFLRGRASGRASDLAAVFAFFALAVVCAVAIVLAGYDPLHSPLELGLAALVTGLIATLALSAPLWIGWRLVGAKRHYVKILAVLLYQSGVLHIVLAFTMVIVFFGMDLGSRHSVEELIAQFMRPGESLQAGLETMRARIRVLTGTAEVRVSSLAAVLIIAAGAVWLVASWGAYRDALGFGRVRSLGALAAAALVLWATGRLFALVY